ncbi:MAG TPA: flagellar motor switch protein FliG [Acidimicrobiales bacterium]|nr:flagellar motor switch protein FliG [Acidimicrobiales bacterium]
MSSTILTGPQKAAVVLAQLDTNRASKILRSMTESDVVDLMSAMATLPTLETDSVRGILADFANQANALVEVGQGGVDLARKLLRDRLGAAKAEEVLEKFVQATHNHPLALLHRVDAQQIVSFIADEHPQTIAAVLAHLPADHGAQVVANMDEALRTDVARRIATMGRLSPDVVQVVADVLEQKLAAVLRSGLGSTSEVGGVSTLVAILNQTDRSSEKQILAELEESDPELAEEIRNEMFVFDDVINLDDRTLQRVLRNVVPKELAVALKGVSDDIREKFLRNMSERAAIDLNEEIELLGPTRVSQVEAAQTGVVRVVRELDAAGEIVLARGEDEFV